MEETTQTPDYQFDIDSMPLTNKIVDAHQEGNWLVGVTEHGIRFRQHIPQGKRLNKIGGKFVLEDMVIG